MNVHSFTKNGFMNNIYNLMSNIITGRCYYILSESITQTYSMKFSSVIVFDIHHTHLLTCAIRIASDTYIYQFVNIDSFFISTTFMKYMYMFNINNWSK